MYSRHDRMSDWKVTSGHSEGDMALQSRRKQSSQDHEPQRPVMVRVRDR